MSGKGIIGDPTEEEVNIRQEMLKVVQGSGGYVRDAESCCLLPLAGRWVWCESSRDWS